MDDGPFVGREARLAEPEAARVLPRSSANGWTETRPRGSHRVLITDESAAHLGPHAGFVAPSNWSPMALRRREPGGLAT